MSVDPKVRHLLYSAESRSSSYFQIKYILGVVLSGKSVKCMWSTCQYDENWNFGIFSTKIDDPPTISNCTILLARNLRADTFSMASL